MTQKTSAIRAYFDEADYGNNHWAAWAGGLWVIMVMVVFAQVIVAIPMFAGMMLVDPEVLEGVEPPVSEASYQTLAGMAFAVGTLGALISYFVRDNFGADKEKTVLSIAGAFALLSTAGFVYFMQANSGSGGGEFLNALIGNSKLVYGAMLAVFPIIALGVYIAQKGLHKRSLRSLHTAAPKYRWGRMFFSMAVFWIIAAILTFVGHAIGNSPAELVFDPSRFFGFALVSLLFIPLQSATEEIILRGYLNQGLSRIIRNPWIIFFITSAGFAALHLGNPEIAQSGLEGNKLITLSGYFLFGMFACLLTYIDGGLETAIGVHAANNLFAAVIVGYEHSALPTPTVFKIGFNSDGDIYITMLGLAVVCLIMYFTRGKTPTTALKT